jgi:hypothetical protein
MYIRRLESDMIPSAANRDGEVNLSEKKEKEKKELERK